MRELDSRINDGLDGRLLWDPIDGRVMVTVTDWKHGDELRFEVHERARAREAFEHPFSYAAWCGGARLRPTPLNELAGLTKRPTNGLRAG
jgi:hypothetical protein